MSADHDEVQEVLGRQGFVTKPGPRRDDPKLDRLLAKSQATVVDLADKVEQAGYSELAELVRTRSADTRSEIDRLRAHARS